MKYIFLAIFICFFIVGALGLYYVKLFGTPDLTQVFGKRRQPDNSQRVEVIELNPASEEASPAVGAQAKPVIKLFFHNQQRNPSQSEACGLVYPVEREDLRPTAEIREATASGEYALNLLFAGPDENEKARGYSSLFSNQTSNILKGVRVTDETAYVNLVDVRKIMPKINLSCESAEFISEIGETLRQFGSIRNIIYAINGNPKTFYEWMNLGCNQSNDNCNSQPFK